MKNAGARCAFAASLAALVAGCATGVAPIAASEPDPRSREEFLADLPAGAWKEIAPEDLMIIEWRDATTDAPQRVVIQLMDTAYGATWGANVRAMARNGFWDEGAIYRVIPGFVAQWGLFPPEDEAAEPDDPVYLRPVPENSYAIGVPADAPADQCASQAPICDVHVEEVRLVDGWVFGSDGRDMWPLACVGTVGVARSMAPDQGSGTALYAMMRNTHRRLDRNLGIVGRVVDGFDRLEALPAATGPNGVYDEPAKAAQFTSVSLASELPAGERPRYRMLDTASEHHVAWRRRLTQADGFLRFRYPALDACDPRLVPVLPID